MVSQPTDVITAVSPACLGSPKHVRGDARVCQLRDTGQLTHLLVDIFHVCGQDKDIRHGSHGKLPMLRKKKLELLF